jgi:hypothetical protein
MGARLKRRGEGGREGGVSAIVLRAWLAREGLTFERWWLEQTLNDVEGINDDVDELTVKVEQEDE